MANSWERLRYDENAYDQYLKESTGALLYQLDPSKFYNCAECRPAQPGYFGQGVSVSKKNTLVEVENDLKNITRKSSKDPNMAYMPTKATQNVPMRHLQECNPNRDETRASNPACNLRGTGVSQHVFFQPLQDPQNPCAWNRLSKTDDRQDVKDKCSPKYSAPMPVTGLPTGELQTPMPGCACNSVEAVFTDPLNPTYLGGAGYNQPVHYQPALAKNYKDVLAFQQCLGGLKQ